MVNVSSFSCSRISLFQPKISPALALDLRSHFDCLYSQGDYLERLISTHPHIQLSKPDLGLFIILYCNNVSGKTCNHESMVFRDFAFNDCD